MRSFGTETSSVFKPADSEVAGEGNDGEGSDTGGGGGGDGGGGGGEALGWITSALVFAFYAALLYYVTVLAPGQTPVRLLVLPLSLCLLPFLLLSLCILRYN